MKSRIIRNSAVLHVLLTAFCFQGLSGLAIAAKSQRLKTRVLADGSYDLALSGQARPILIADVAARIDDRWVGAMQYPKHSVQQHPVQGYFGAATEWQVTFSGLSGVPDLAYRLRAYENEPFADIQVTVKNPTGRAVQVQAIRAIEARGSDIVDLDGPAAQERVLSDSFSEDRPVMKIYDLADGPGGMHRGVGSQLIYNLQSHLSFFAGALSTDRFLTILRLHLAEPAGSNPRVAAYEVDCTGTTEIQKAQVLRNSGAADQIPLSLELPSGQSMQSETILLGAGSDYHRQLQTYGALISRIHHARTTAPPLMGWWSWTAFYFGLNEGAALTNATWLAEHLKPFGYDVFHIDEGYQYARGEYSTPNATLFPHGMIRLEYKIHGMGLMPAIWTAPFEVSSRSWVFEQHPDWLVSNAAGKPIQVGTEKTDKLYALDTTDPGAEDYLRQTYTTLVNDWEIRYIKLDFMDDTAVEGHYYRPDTTAMEAQRIGLAIIRQAVGNDVYLDKDGSPMLNPVGYVDYGRISRDTAHSFAVSKEVATGIAARYYMNRNFFTSDPDAFSVSAHSIEDQANPGKPPLPLNAARVAMALAAVSGGMLEIGDNLPSLEGHPNRMSLIMNQDLIDMVRLGRASVPVDLMDYREIDLQPSVFLLNESARQKMLTVFNWTSNPVQRTIDLPQIGIADAPHLSAMDVLAGKQCVLDAAGFLHLMLPAQSVAVVKVIDNSIPAVKPDVALSFAQNGRTGEPVVLAAKWKGGDPVVSYRWNLGDGTTQPGRQISHTWTIPGSYNVHLTASGLGGETTERSMQIHIAGQMSTDFMPAENRRLH